MLIYIVHVGFTGVTCQPVNRNEIVLNLPTECFENKCWTIMHRKQEYLEGTLPRVSTLASNAQPIPFPRFWWKVFCELKLSTLAWFFQLPKNPPPSSCCASCHQVAPSSEELPSGLACAEIRPSTPRLAEEADDRCLGLDHLRSLLQRCLQQQQTQCRGLDWAGVSAYVLKLKRIQLTMFSLFEQLLLTFWLEIITSCIVLT